MPKIKTPYEACPVEHLDKVPPGLRPEIRQTVCRECGQPVFFHGPTYDELKVLNRRLGRKLRIMCGGCVEKLVEPEADYYELWAFPQNVIREFGKAEVEMN